MKDERETCKDSWIYATPMEAGNRIAVARPWTDHEEAVPLQGLQTIIMHVRGYSEGPEAFVLIPPCILEEMRRCREIRLFASRFTSEVPDVLDESQVMDALIKVLGGNSRGVHIGFPKAEADRITIVVLTPGTPARFYEMDVF